MIILLLGAAVIAILIAQYAAGTMKGTGRDD